MRLRPLPGALRKLLLLSTVAVMRRETAGWKWPALQFGYMLFLAYVGAYVTNLLF